jgi:AcrR family transcriptional regulator
MARKPQQKRAKVTVETIIEAGFISVAQSGIEGTTTRQIAEIAGIGVGSLYEYFTNKEDIYDAMSQHFVNEVLKMLRDSTDELVRMSLEDLVRKMLIQFSDLLQKNEGRYLKCIRYAGHFEYARYAQQVESALTEIVMRYVMMNPQYLRLPDIATMSYICINGGIFTVIRQLSFPSHVVSFDGLVNGLCRMISSYVDAEMAALGGTGELAKPPEAT